MLHILLFTLLAADAPGTPWPAMEADTLAGTKLKMPADAAGQPALVVMSFSREGGAGTKAWAERYAREGGRLYIAPVLERAPRLIRGLIRAGLRKEIPPALHGRTLLIYTGEAEWKKRTGFQPAAEKEPFLLLLDRQGRIQWQYHGAFNEAAYAEFRRALAMLGS